MLADEHPVAERRWKIGSGRPREAERCSVRAERVVGLDRFLDHVWPFWLDSSVDMATVVAERKTIEGSVLHRGHVVRNEVASYFVTLVHCDPQRAACRLP